MTDGKAALTFRGWDAAKTHEEILAKITSPLLLPQHLRDECSLQMTYSSRDMRGADIKVITEEKDGPSKEIKGISAVENT